MKKSLSISALLQSITAVMILALVVGLSSSAKQAYERREIAERILFTVDLTRNLFLAMQTLRVERGTINTALETPSPIDSETENDVSVLRTRSQQALDTALAKLGGAARGIAKAASEVQDARREFTFLRNESDVVLREPKTQRPVDISARWTAAGGKFVRAIDALTERLSEEINQADPFITEMMKIKQLGWVARDAAGFDRLLIGAALANAKILTLDQEKRFAAQMGRVEAAWQVIEEDTQQPRMPRDLDNAVAKARQLYFGDLRAKRNKIIDALAAGEQLSISGAEWVRLSNPPLEAIMAVPNTAFDLAEADAAKKLATAEYGFRLAIYLALTFFLLGSATVLFVIRPAIRRIKGITESVRNLASGDISSDIPFIREGDEIGQLARALSVFRETAVENQRMEAEIVAKERAAAIDASFRDLFEHNPVPMFIYEQESMRILEGNDAAVLQYGYSREQFVTMSISDLLPPEDVWRLGTQHLVSHNGGLAKVGLRRHRKADGTVFHVEVARHDLSFRGLIGSLVTAIDVTQREIAEQALQEKAARLQRSQEHLARAQQLSHLGSDDRDLRTDAAEWSEETYRIFGVSPETFVPSTENFISIVHPDDRSIIAQTRDEIRKGATPAPFEYRIIRPDGEVRIIYRENQLFRDDQGRPIRLLGTLRDVTERREMETRQRQQEERLEHMAEDLQQSQRHLSLAQQIANVGSFERDLRTGKVFWSEETYRIIGRASSTPPLARDELLAMVIHPEDRATYEAGMIASENGENPDPVEYRIIRPDGGVRWIHTVSTTILDEQGQPSRRIGTYQDVTEKHEAEDRLNKLADELRHQKEHLASAQRISRTGSIDRHLRTGEAVWSEEARRIFGLVPDSPTPTREEFVALFHPEDRAKFLTLLAAAEGGQLTDPIECRVIRPDGAIRWVRNISDAIFDDGGKPIRRIGTFQDVTEMHEAQQRQRHLEESLRAALEAGEQSRLEVQASNLELESRVEERTTQLRSAQQELVKKERLSTLGQLTATVAHELRNPLSAIRNTIFAVEETAKAQGLSLERPLARMDRSIRRCEHIIADLLDFTRLRQLKLTSVALDEWLNGVIEEQVVPNGMMLECRLNARGLNLPLDVDRFRQVLINLIENAAQAIDGSESAERRITVSTSATPFPEIKVEDTGPGIGPDALPKVFEPLFSTKSFGTGLGLPTVKQIVEQHGGSISIKSEVGRGTVVSITLGDTATNAVAA